MKCNDCPLFLPNKLIYKCDALASFVSYGGEYYPTYEEMCMELLKNKGLSMFQQWNRDDNNAQPKATHK